MTTENTDTPLKADCPSATCSRSFADLLESLDAWIEDALKNSKPIGLTLSRARVTITEQHDRIGEILAALERQNQEVKRLRNTARKFVEDYLEIRWGPDGDCGATRLVQTLDCDINPIP